MRISDWSSDVCSSDLGLAHHERLEAFPAQFLQHGGGGDVAVPFRTAFVRCIGKDGRRDGADLVVGQGTFRTQHRGTGSKARSEEHTSELQSLMRISYAVFCLKKKKKNKDDNKREKN